MQIKQCTNADILFPLMQSWKETCNDETFGLLANVEWTIKHLDEIINRPGSAIFAMLDDNESAVGMIGVILFPSPISINIIAQEHFWYVMPEYRSGGIRLFKTAIRWAKSQGASHFMSSASMLASNLHDKVCSLYERLGMKKYETTYICKLGD